MAISVERDADCLHIVQMMPLPPQNYMYTLMFATDRYCSEISQIFSDMAEMSIATSSSVMPSSCG